jgi:hypothetical protein
LSKTLEHKEAKMTFHFHDRTFRDPLVPVGSEAVGRETRFRAWARPRLVARWQRGPDGRLERRWHRVPINFWTD